MPDIKKFTGFITPDGLTHTSIKAATEHTRDLKAKEAIELLVKNTCALEQPNISATDDGSVVIFADQVASYLLHNKTAILAAFNPEITTRKKRTASVPDPAKVAAKAKPKVAEKVEAAVDTTESPLMGAKQHEGVLNLDFEGDGTP